ncbi:hypothetical protein ABMA27_006479 [Loxostege sticticalis]|uniref:Integrase catalytic domain-containing protein n=1 Tax=Loxostege sticticalis TaxID=481309 RepID=A0ABR3IJ98_LOXSC
MSTDKDNTSSDLFDKQFILLTAKKERLFSRINDLFSLTTNISNYASRDNETFMAKSEPIDVMRSQFETIIDDLNDHQLSLDSSFKPDYKPLDAFDDLYLRVKHTRNRIMEVLRSDQSSSSSNSNIGCNIKLPPIELPSFDGKTQNWPKFYESFKSNIHNNNQLTDSQRVQYLVGKLTHDALKFTAGIVPTGETYNIIWESLVKKFQDKRALGTHYLNNILDSKGCINTSNSLDTFIGMYTSSVAALKQLGIEDLSDFILFHCALRKIDSQTMQAFELAFRNKEIMFKCLNSRTCTVDVNHTIPSLSLSAEVRPTSSILLSTAQVYAKSQNGNKIIIRCLIDNGSQNNLITIDCCKALNLVIIPLSNSFVKGIGSASRPILGYVNLDIESRLPTHYITKGDIGYLEGLPLADLTWNIPGNVDVVLGAQLFPYIYLGNKVESGTSAPPALLTAFGFVLMGDYPCNESQNKVSKTFFSALALNDLVQKFWQLEEIPNMQFLSPEETECENLFAASVTRADDGRYSVALPFSKDPSALGNSRTAAQRRLMALERKFKQSPDLQEIYSNVLNEYIDNGYLSQVAESDVTDEGYYIPHHAVTHPDKPMPRIVLDASAATHTGLSLNDVLHTGPNFIIQKFSAFIQEFPLISSLKIPRHVGVLRDSTVLIVAFCDASMNGYGCVIYLHTTDPAGNITVRLLCAKSKVSPTKVTTLARLELCAAVLMSKLIRTVHETYRARHPIAGTYAFSDSTIALSWIHSSPLRWSVFVSNRVAQCQENLPPENYYHVAGCENPSDCLSRGMLPSQLLSHDLWWNGPSWMWSPPSEWPVKPFTPSNAGQLPELRAKVLTATVHCEPLILNELAQRVSSWDKLLRIVVYILRFIKKVSPSSGIVNNLMTAEKAMIRSVQRVHFAEDIKALNKDKLPSKKLQSLFVFLDEDGLLRIGGRLSNSDLPFEAKHPLLLPKHDPVVDLLIDHYHIMNCHTGPGLLISILRQRFWILDARTVVRARVRKCNYCFRVNPSHPTPMMADLPSYRVSEAKAFVHTGVDYAGPLRITLTRRRGQHSQKAYICLFVCLVTKAIHIELVSELTSDAFLAAFKRFISRRGPVSCLYSDNGTNFVGAKAQLDDIFKILIDSEFQSALKQELSARRIEWKMIPPRSPHFGGIWEGNIKNLKTHLHRVIGNQLLTYEELLTVLVQIECIMNSRPLTVVSSDPSPEVITPAHFLMSTPLQYLPAVDLKDVRINLVQRKQLLDSMVQSYWKKWRLEYLHTLQVRQKWTSPDRRIEVGTVVLVGQDDCPPLSWPLGVITEIHPGSDKVVRVATVKTKCGIFKRPVVKLYPIPTQ